MILLNPARAAPIPRDAPDAFSALMDLYECNYINLRRLLPVVPPPATTRVSRVPGGLDLHLRVIARCRYTSDLSLNHELRREDGVTTAEPNLRIRVYHDAQSAEVITAHPRYGAAFAADFRANHHADGASIHIRWTINRFLYKWLTYCLQQGHRFTSSSEPSV